MDYEETTLRSGDTSTRRPGRATPPTLGAATSGAPSRPLTDPDGPRTMVLTTQHLPHLQRMLGNRATSDLILQRESDDGAAESTGLPLQRDRRGKGHQEAGKGEPLPGRRKRRRMAEEDELAAMDRANAAWEEHQTDEEEEVDRSHNPFAVLADVAAGEAEARQDAAEQPALPRLTLAMLREANDNVLALRAILTSYYPQELASQISRTWRMSRITTEERGFADTDALVVAAGGRLVAHEEITASSPASGALNAKGGPVSNLTKGKGDGYKAGTGAAWHVHHEHVKYGSVVESRVNFDGRTKDEILLALAGKSAAISDTTHLATCQAWIKKNRD